MIVTFDLGTSRLKVAAFLHTGELLGEVALPHTEFVDKRNNNFTWQSSDEWWSNCATGFHQLINDFGLSPSAVTGFSVSGRGGAAIFIDKKGDVLIDPWLDNRHRSELQFIRDAHPEISLYAATLASKFHWAAVNQPGLADRTHKILYAKDYILFRLTGEYLTDPSSGPDRPDWPAIDTLDPALLPDIGIPWEKAGTLHAGAALALGCPAGIPVALGAHDGISANTGCGMTGEGQFALTLGTHAVSRTVSARVQSQAHRFYGYPPAGHVYGGNAWYAGKVMSWWLTRMLSMPENLDRSGLNIISEHLQSSTPGAGGILFYPYLGGQVAPESRPPGSGQFVGLALSHTRSDLTRAVFEGLAISIARVHRHLTQTLGVSGEVCLTGGGIVFGEFVQMIADLLQQPLQLQDTSCEGRGAAIFGAVAIGVYASCEEASANMITTGTTIAPSQQQTFYATLLAKFEEGEMESHSARN